MVVPLDIVPGEWATFRMKDDLGTGTAAAAAAYFAFAAGMALGRLGGDSVAVRIGRANLARWGTVVSTPVAVGTLAGTAVLGVGQAMVLVVLPTAVALVVLAGPAIRVRSTVPAEVGRRAPSSPEGHPAPGRAPVPS